MITSHVGANFHPTHVIFPTFHHVLGQALALLRDEQMSLDGLLTLLA